MSTPLSCAGTIPCAHHARNEVDASEIDELVDFWPKPDTVPPKADVLPSASEISSAAGAGGLEYDILIVAGALD